MYSLLMLLLERSGIIVTIAFVLTRLPIFRRLISREPTGTGEKLFLAVLFGMFGILGTYTGIPVQANTFLTELGVIQVAPEQAIANSRAVSAFIAGILGGPAVGLGAGFIAGFHRFSLGGFTALACGLSTALEGLLAGFIGQRFGRVHIPAWIAFVAGALGETLQMAIILAMAKPFDRALELVQLIGLPMILANAAGICIFVLILQSVLTEEQRAGALHAQKALAIADKTLPYLRKGLNFESALAAAHIIKQATQVTAVALTDQHHILAHVGLGNDHHRSGAEIYTEATKKVLASGQPVVTGKREEIGCQEASCPLTSAIIVPLKREDTTVGTLKLYFGKRNQISAVDVEMAQGLAHLFSTQLELARIENQARLLAKAEIKALQAQVNPHFLFNSLNVIVSLCRQNPETARQLIIHLGEFFRQNLQSSYQELVSLERELGHVKSYLAIEQARFGTNLTVEFDIEPDTLSTPLPPLTLQPLVENAIKHGIQPLGHPGVVRLVAYRKDAHVVIRVTDNGQGMPPEVLANCLAESAHETGKAIGLKNVHRRLSTMFGHPFGLQVFSSNGKGTEVQVSVPAEGGGWLAGVNCR
ncbi:MAG: LytS/YhcK type 5TM receptor domain-containing protein [Bacillota bacterium]